ncbi:hypothetical protein Q5H93_07160 [Hymenobacter sp. ASUV-10]|uniref:Uncharacterized protein n=1 Tax=Hymenobacter aranciens TaxID=3063996 RepID=A0ABT9B8E1_9BACT|nr:hypothetical protein [Hymenobacter sp. ASUV-10]MDO7874505.1 hypothetical protein [Hymenobacter sp. ASUV-10]
MTTLIRSLSWSALLASLFLLSVAARAQSSSAKLNPTLAMYTTEQHLGLYWEQATPDSTQTRNDSTAAARPMLLDLRIGRPTSYSVGVVLYWTSTGEQPATQFIVERRDEGQAHYRAVAVLPGQGAGQELHSYSFVDDGNANPAPSSYRLRQVCAGECLNQLSAAQVVPGATVAPPEPQDESMVSGPSLAVD